MKAMNIEHIPSSGLSDRFIDRGRVTIRTPDAFTWDIPLGAYYADWVYPTISRRDLRTAVLNAYGAAQRVPGMQPYRRLRIGFVYSGRIR